MKMNMKPRTQLVKGFSENSKLPKRQRRVYVLQVVVSWDEARQIKKNARNASLSVSTYMRIKALNTDFKNK